MNRADNRVLVPSHDHGYTMATTYTGKAIYNKNTCEWSEYHGEEYLQDGDKVIDNVTIVCY